MTDQAAAAGGAGGESAGAGAWTPPQGIPQEYLGASADETLGKLLGGFNEVNTRFSGLREKLATMPKPPASPDEYKWEPGEKFKPWFNRDLSEDPAMKAARVALHKHGIPADKFGPIIEDIYGPMIEAGALPAPFDPAKEVKDFMEGFKLDRTAATKALTDAETFAKGLGSQLKDVPEPLKERVNTLLLSLTDTAEGNTLLRALSGRLAENGIRIAGEAGQAGALTESDLRRLDADPRIDPRNRDHPDAARRFDPELRARYDDAYKRMTPKSTAF